MDHDGTHRIIRLLSIVQETHKSALWRGEDIERGAAVIVRVHRAVVQDVKAGLAAAGAALIRLRHPHLIEGRDLRLTKGGQLALVMEPWDHLSIPPRGMSWPEACAIARDVALGVHELHQEGVLHLGICREAVRVWDEAGRRWGVLVDPESPFHAWFGPLTGQTIVERVAPEILQGQRPTLRADLWGVGRLLEELLTPGEGEPSITLPPQELVALRARLADPTPAARPESALAVVDELEELLASVGVVTRRPFAKARRWELGAERVEALLLRPVLDDGQGTIAPVGPRLGDDLSFESERGKVMASPWPGRSFRVLRRADQVITVGGIGGDGSKVELAPGDVVETPSLVAICLPGPRTRIDVPPPERAPDDWMTKTDPWLGVGPAPEPRDEPAALASVAPTESLSPGPSELKLGDWRILRMIGSGGMTEVYEVLHARTGRRGAAKVLHRAMASDRDVVERFRREARCLSLLDHPGVVRLLDADLSSDGRPFQVAELLAGESLQTYSEGSKRLPLGEVIEVIREILEILACVHETGLVHRDIKPDNLLLHEGRIKLLDFGISKLPAEIEPDKLTQTGAIIGTPFFMAPERITATKEVDHRADLYSLGVVLYGLLCGRPVFGADSVSQLFAKVLSETPEPPTTHDPTIPAWLSDFTLRLLAKDPEDRFQSARATLEELRAHAGTEASPVAIEPAPSEAVLSPVEGASELNLGKWTVLGRIGEGGFATYEQVRHPEAEVLGVAEIVRPELAAASREAGGRLHAAARAVARLAHPRLMDVIDLGFTEAGLPFVVSRLIRGESLQQRLRRCGSLPPEQAVALGREVAEGLAAIHAVDIVHRDVNPGQILISRSGEVSLVGFGLARLPDRRVTRTGTAMGTAHYMAPEQIQGDHISPSVDIYSLGITIYEVLTGSPPFSGDDFTKLLAKHLFGAPRRPISPLGPIPGELVALVMAMLAKEPAERPTAASLVRRFDALLRGEAAPPTLTGPEPVTGAFGRGTPSPVEPTTGAFLAPAEPSRLSAEALLERAGLLEPIRAGFTEKEGLPRFRARDGGRAVTVFMHQPQPVITIMDPRVRAMRWLMANPSSLFVPFEREVTLDDGSSALVRRDPVPPRVTTGEPWEPAPALAVASVVHHALIELSERGRRFDGFDADELRAELESPAAFACLLEPPVQDDGRKMQTLTLAGASPDLLMGGLGSHGDVAYSVGILLHLLLVGQAPFFDARSVLERIERRASEDPPPLAGYRPDLDPRLCLWLDRVIARDPSKGRSGGALAIELGLLELLEPWPEWHGAALRVLTTASSLPEPEPGGDPEPAPRVRPTLIEGQKVSLWTVETHMAFGGEAELYRVRDDEGRRGVLKLWYDERVDPFSEGFRQFRLRMMECAKHPGFPAVYESDKLTRGRPRAYMVLEEVRGRSWRDRIRSGDRPKAPELLELGEALLEALAVAQDQFGLVGDVSAGNVMLRPAPGGEAPVLLDVAMPDRDRAAQVGYGTPGYLAPEVLGGQAPDGGSDVFSAGAPLYCAPEQLSGEGVGTPSDLYALGLLLYDLVLGRPPSQDGVRRALHLNRLAKAVASGDRPTELTHHDGDPRLAPLLALLASLTHPEPERRPTEVVLP